MAGDMRVHCSNALFYDQMRNMRHVMMEKKQIRPIVKTKIAAQMTPRHFSMRSRSLIIIIALFVIFLSTLYALRNG